MSKAVDDLREAYSAAYQTKLDSYDYDETALSCIAEAERAGIAAVVRALAPDDDEIAAYNRLSYKVQEQLKCECEYLPEDRCIRCSVVDALKCLETRYEILGDAGADAVRKAYWDKHYGVDEPTAPATGPAPAVCDVKELVKRLREVFVEDRGHGHTTEWTRNLDGHEAADALEAMAGEVERLTSQRDAKHQKYLKTYDLMGSESHRAEAAEAERDRLKAALKAFVKHFGPLQDNAMLHEDVRNCYRLARKALGGDE